MTLPVAMGIIGLSCMALVAQTTSPVTALASTPGVVSGRVFAITVAGDLKPARLAKIYLFSVDAGATKEWSDQLHNATIEFQALSKHEWDTWSGGILEANRLSNSGREAFLCRRELRLTYDRAAEAVTQWIVREHKDQLLVADADEEGHFKIAVPVPGNYMLVARGQAGLYEAFWGESTVKVNSGSEIVVKLSHPEKSCLVNGV